PFDQDQQFTISAWFATLGYGVPASIDAKLTYPDRQVWSISGDGGFAINMQEIITQTKYQLPIINIILNDKSYGFIKHAQLNSEFEFGVDIEEVDWAMAAEGMGAIGFSVKTVSELKAVFSEIKQLEKDGNTRPIVIDAKILYRNPIDTSVVHIDPEIYSSEVIKAYKDRFDAHDLTSFSEILNELDNKQ
ncbi:MAG TPA: thiamine pyrophosphate-dependent enzyme, partial [Erysipelotrichaceae bacterium]|nr:thiamine pyrophosphate-dependent enzyme [Erysipelotrichaceae bacterium]